MQIRERSKVRAKRFTVAMGLIGVACTAASAQAATIFSDDAESVTSMSAALSQKIFSGMDGAVAVSKNYAHSGSQSYQLTFPANESQAYMSVKFSARRHVFLRWWEIRERAGDFSGAKDYDWSAEKTMRFRSATIGSTGIDYCLGWEADSGQRGTSGTDGPGPMVLFGNSTASNGSDILRATPKISRGEWNMYEVEIDLGTQGQSNGLVRIWVNDKLIGEKTGVSMLPKTNASLEEIWIGGWYTGLSPNPSPARRYVDDIVVSDSKIGFGDTSSVRPNPPTSVSVQ